jgi:hypothetical protein
MSRRAEVQALLQDYISTQSAEEWGSGCLLFWPLKEPLGQ